MFTRKTWAVLAAALIGSTALSGVASADTATMWVRASGTNAAAHLVDLWNATHPDKIELTTIPDNQMVTKLATGVQAREVPDLVSFDLIYMPDFMKAGFLVDLTADLKADPNYASVAQAYKDIATYEGKIYGAGFTPDVSILVWNKDLFKKAGLDPEKPPRTIGEIHEDAKKVRALGGDVYGFYFSGACPGCNIFTSSPMMVAAGSKILPANGNDDALTGEGVKDVLEAFKAMWNEGLIPKNAQADNGANFTSEFMTGKIGVQGTGGFLLSELKKNAPNLDFGVTFLPGAKEGQASSFVGGDVVAIPAGSKHLDLAKKFIAWELTDEAQLEGLAKNNILPSRPALADNKYFAADPRVVTTAKALGIGYVPWVYHFADMVNSDSSPWINMFQRAIFDGDVDGAIAEARQKMKEIAGE
ncbi:carbohydrate ABC transporter substrate-binding protein (CUT1 family) [Roseiarcus fermentans]|uniref:Carbohydrate ABC transporter substrate-binding protein (CUT1 family) n=1 Tax=Roseiarcus fermentans TaxID=1473586 RepID=A0A366FNS3_9HYPH|nr:sugar ABC transporter substrate-binding protein [Roseiarcus fermentans]RBP16221.1 carbohydrate ABC transporter substrate-binding protein (CUT1 family) [Roseiarcus fermentans]